MRLKLEAAERERDQWKQQAEKAEQREREAREDFRQLMDVHQQQTRLLSASPSPSEQATKKSTSKRSIGQRFVAWWDGVG